MNNLSKKLRKQLRELISKAYSKELSSHLNELSNKFDDWKNQRIDCWDLNELIHKFHNGISRDLYKTYNYSKDQEVLLIARALRMNLLEKDEIPIEVHGIVDQLMNLFEK